MDSKPKALQSRKGQQRNNLFSETLPNRGRFTLCECHIMYSKRNFQRSPGALLLIVKGGADHQGGTGWRNRGPQEATGKPRTGAALPGLLFLQPSRTATRTAQEATRRAQRLPGGCGLLFPSPGRQGHQNSPGSHRTGAALIAGGAADRKGSWRAKGTKTIFFDYIHGFSIK